MKKIVSLVLLLFAVAQANANDVEPKSPVGMSVIKSGTIVKLYYRGEQRGKVKVTIYNQRGTVVFKEVLNDTEHFMRPYNFASLPDGEYSIELNDESAKRYQKITYHSPAQQIVAHLTRLSKDGNRYVLAVPNISKETLTVTIYDGFNRVLFQETQTVHGNFAKMYNLNGVSGCTTFEVVNRNGKIARLKPSCQ